MEIIFNLLCKCLELIGSIFGYSYKEISVIICIYGCPIICILSSIIIYLTIVHKTINKITIFKLFLLFISGLYIAANLTFFSLICEHYWESDMNLLFQQCKNDLELIAANCNITYEYCNIIIYVYLFFSILGINSGITYLIYKFLNAAK